MLFPDFFFLWIFSYLNEFVFFVGHHGNPSRRSTHKPLCSVHTSHVDYQRRQRWEQITLRMQIVEKLIFMWKSLPQDSFWNRVKIKLSQKNFDDTDQMHGFFFKSTPQLLVSFCWFFPGQSQAEVSGRSRIPLFCFLIGLQSCQHMI